MNIPTDKIIKRKKYKYVAFMDGRIVIKDQKHRKKIIVMGELAAKAFKLIQGKPNEYNKADNPVWFISKYS